LSAVVVPNILSCDENGFWILACDGNGFWRLALPQPYLQALGKTG